MGKITRISVSLEEEIVKRFDILCQQRGIPTRSEAVKHLICSAFVEEEWQCGDNVVAVITIIYDHHKSSIVQKITEAQHCYGEIIICSQHAHLDHDNCLENIIARGKVEDVKKLHKLLSSIKGIKHAVLSMSTTGKNY